MTTMQDNTTPAATFRSHWSNFRDRVNLVCYTPSPDELQELVTNLEDLRTAMTQTRDIDHQWTQRVREATDPVVHAILRLHFRDQLGYCTGCTAMFGRTPWRQCPTINQLAAVLKIPLPTTGTATE